MFGVHSSSAFAWLVSAVAYGCALLETPGDAGRGGGPAAGGNTAVADTPADTGADATTHTDAGADDGAGADARGDVDDRDDDRFPDDDDVDALPEPNVRTRLRKTQRFAQRVRPIADKFRDPATGRLMTPDQVDTILSSHREFQGIDSVLRRSPRAVQVLMEEQQRLERGGDDRGGADPAADAPAAFDDSSWPFERETPEGKALLALAKQNHELLGKVQGLERSVGGVNNRIEQQTVTQLEGEWKRAAFKAADELPGEYRPLFIRSVRREFNLLRAQNRLTKANAQKVIDQELAEVRAANKGKHRTDVTRRSEMVAANTGLPRTPRPGTVVPATDKTPNGKRETIKDASKGFLSKYR